MASRSLGRIFKNALSEKIQRGEKTETRRLVSARDFRPLGPESWTFERLCYSRHVKFAENCFSDRTSFVGYVVVEGEVIDVCRLTPPLGVGDELWTRETFWQRYVDFPQLGGGTKSEWLSPGPRDEVRDVRSFREPEDGLLWKKRSAIHQPKWAARSFCEITAVEPVRLSSIDQASAKAEGAIPDGDDFVAGFARLWDNIHGEGAFDRDPIVFAYKFRRKPC